MITAIAFSVLIGFSIGVISGVAAYDCPQCKCNCNCSPNKKG